MATFTVERYASASERFIEDALEVAAQPARVKGIPDISGARPSPSLELPASTGT
jgi:hypothetical protein